MKIDKATKRDKARHKAQHGMKRSGDSVKIIQSILIKKGQGKNNG